MEATVEEFVTIHGEKLNRPADAAKDMERMMKRDREKRS